MESIRFFFQCFAIAFGFMTTVSVGSVQDNLVFSKYLLHMALCNTSFSGTEKTHYYGGCVNKI